MADGQSILRRCDRVARIIDYESCAATGSISMDQRPIFEDNGLRNDVEMIRSDRANDGAARGRSGIWISVNARGDGHHAYVATGPFAIILALLALGILLTAAFLFLLGTLPIWIPVLGVIVAVLFLSSLFRGYFQRFRWADQQGDPCVHRAEAQVSPHEVVE
jgi:hypothetical protein